MTCFTPPPSRLSGSILAVTEDGEPVYCRHDGIGPGEFRRIVGCEDVDAQKVKDWVI